MTFEQWLIFIPAAFALNVFPGPNNILSVAHASRYGFAPAFWAGFARLPPFAVMIALVAAGLGALLSASETAFIALKWIGAAYLLYLGGRMLLAEPEMEQGAASADIGALMRREFIVAASNPKAMAIFAAFMPQFLAPGAPFWLQLVEMGCAFLVMEVVAMAIYAGGGVALKRSGGASLKWIGRGSGVALIGSGVALALARRG
ncbi:MAG: LysE family translocator [Hyphomicrobiales bacterium]|nr:LysE family translocator [Hyphomicrobiales bacterium]